MQNHQKTGKVLSFVGVMDNTSLAEQVAGREPRPSAWPWTHGHSLAWVQHSFSGQSWTGETVSRD